MQKNVGFANDNSTIAGEQIFIQTDMDRHVNPNKTS